MLSPAMVPAIREVPDPAQVLTQALRRAAEAWELSQRELARILGVSDATASRLFAGVSKIEPDRKEGELALLFLRSFRSLDALLGGDAARARAWLRASNEHLGGVPADRLQSVEGLVHVVGYLDAMRGKL
jgi:hypothetical protein